MSVIDQLSEKLDKEDILSEAQELVGAFLKGEISYDDWRMMPAFRRGFLAGAIAGNFGAHHPEECWQWLLRVKNWANNTKVKA